MTLRQSRAVAWATALAVALCAATAMPDGHAADAPGTTRRSGQVPGSASQGQRTMQITLRAAAATPLGKPLPLDITLANPGSRPLLIDDPAQSLDIEMHMVYRPTGEDLSFTMGKILTTQLGSVDRHAIEVPPPRPQPIAPGASLAIKPDANTRLFLRPGDYDVFVTHKGSESNHVPLKVELTRESVALLFATARDPQLPYSRREWASDWLVRLYPGFRISLALPDEPPTQRAQREASNQPVYQRFAEWWREQQASEGLDARLEKLR